MFNLDFYKGYSKDNNVSTLGLWVLLNMGDTWCRLDVFLFVLRARTKKWTDCLLLPSLGLCQLAYYREPFRSHHTYTPSYYCHSQAALVCTITNAYGLVLSTGTEPWGVEYYHRNRASNLTYLGFDSLRSCLWICTYIIHILSISSFLCP
jgi:hypothetical protein